MVMRTMLLAACCFMAVSAGAQQKIDLSRDPSKPVTMPGKDNATLLKETQPASDAVQPGDPAALPDGTNNGTTTTTNTMVPMNNGNTQGTAMPLNSTNQQYNLGNGMKTNSTIYYDNQGRVQGSGSSIEFGKKKK